MFLEHRNTLLKPMPLSMWKYSQRIIARIVLNLYRVVSYDIGDFLSFSIFSVRLYFFFNFIMSKIGVNIILYYVIFNEYQSC